MASRPTQKTKRVSTGPQTKLSGRLQCWIRSHADFVAKLPPHPEIWKASKFEVSEVVSGDFQIEEVTSCDAIDGKDINMLVNGAVETVGRAWASPGSQRCKPVSVYRTKPGIRAYADDVIESRDSLPCGHGGFVNLGDGEFACSGEGCDARYERATVEEVFG